MRQSEDWRLTEIVSHEDGRGDPFAAAIRGTRMPMVITDPRLPDHPIVFANEAFQELTGYDRNEIIGRNCRFLQGKDSDAKAVAEIRNAINSNSAIKTDILNYRKDGTTFWNALYISPVRSQDGEVQFFFASQLDVTERYETHRIIAEQKAGVEQEVRLRTADLQMALEAKTLLLHEVDHRVKNNLTMIGSLLRLQARSIPDPKFRDTLDNMLARVDALATVHRRLYQSDDITRFDVSDFADNLVSDVVAASGRPDIAVHSDVEQVTIPANKATAVGLILNELATNALKHAFPDGKAGNLAIGVKSKDGLVRISLSDDGGGFDTDLPPKDSIGRALVKRLSKQIAATTTWRSSSLGTTVTIEFPHEVGG